jgi:hypothetical protein
MLIALVFLLTLEDSQRVRKSRDLAATCAWNQDGGTPARVSRRRTPVRKCDPYLRTLLVPEAQPILSPFGLNSDLRCWDLSWPSVAASGTVSRRPSQLS